jgi:hypothetical protein
MSPRLDRWQTWPPRQLTGRPYIYHAYVGRVSVRKPEHLCCERQHRSAATAARCAKRLAKRLNRCADEAAEAALIAGKEAHDGS